MPTVRSFVSAVMTAGLALGAAGCVTPTATPAGQPVAAGASEIGRAHV